MVTPQAEIFGFPNSLLGIAGFAVVAATGASLLAGAALRRWYWWGLQLGTVVDVALVHWLIFQSLYVIGALCPYCMAVWAVTIPICWYVTLHNLERGHLPVSTRWRPLLATVTRYHTVVITTWFVVILSLIAHRFWDSWLLVFTA